MEAALNAGAEDMVKHEDNSFEVTTSPEKFIVIRAALQEKGFSAADGEVTLCPINKTILNTQDSLQIQRLIDALEDLDDTQEVYTTAIFVE
jgi:transcriptional/translational regulatory protein YebC/TACO1